MYMYILRILSWGTYPRDRSPGSFSQGSLEGRPSRSTPWTDTRGSIYKGFKPVHTFGPRWGVVKSPRLTTNPPHCGTQTFRSACRSVGGTLWRVLRLSPPGVGAVLVEGFVSSRVKSCQVVSSRVKSCHLAAGKH